jgi:beta-glucosidase
MKSCDLVALSIVLFSGPAFAQGYTNESEVSLYGQSPPVYPSREL